MVTNPQVVQLAHNAGFDALFIDMEHSTLSMEQMSAHCSTGLQIGITPFVRVPYRCGEGFVQKVLDAGALGVVFPHVHSKTDAEAAVSISKYPPFGKRSVTGQLPIFQLKPTPTERIIAETNESGSSVILMIETREGVEKVEEIATVPGVEVLLVGSNDLSIDLGVPAQWKSTEFRSALETISKACKKHGKVMGLAGIYEDPEFHSWAINGLGVGFILGQQDSGLLARSAKEVSKALQDI